MSRFLTTAATNIIPAVVPLVACLPNGKCMSSTHTCTLNLPMLPTWAWMASIIPGLAAHSLLLVVTLCNAGCSIIFTKIGCTIVYRGRIIMCGHKCTWTGPWMIPLTGHPTPTPMSEPTALHLPLPLPPMWMPHLLQPSMHNTSTSSCAHHWQQLFSMPLTRAWSSLLSRD